MLFPMCFLLFAQGLNPVVGLWLWKHVVMVTLEKRLIIIVIIIIRQIKMFFYKWTWKLTKVILSAHEFVKLLISFNNSFLFAIYTFAEISEKCTYLTHYVSNFSIFYQRFWDPPSCFHTASVTTITLNLVLLCGFVFTWH